MMMSVIRINIALRLCAHSMQDPLVRSELRRRSAEPTNRCADCLAEKDLNYNLTDPKSGGPEQCIAHRRIQKTLG